jgi:hypothetical protein
MEGTMAAEIVGADAGRDRRRAQGGDEEIYGWLREQLKDAAEARSRSNSPWA